MDSSSSKEAGSQDASDQAQVGGYTPGASPPLGTWFPGSNSMAADSGVTPRQPSRFSSTTGFDPGYTTPAQKRRGRSATSADARYGTVRRDQHLRGIEFSKRTMTCGTDRDTIPILGGATISPDEIESATPVGPN